MSSFDSLLRADEEKIRNELRADASIDQNRKQSVDRLSELFSGMLLRYNADSADDQRRQAIADCMTAAVRDELDLLLAGNAKKEISKRKTGAGGIIGILFAVIFCLLAALLIQRWFLVGCVCIVFAAAAGYLGGRLWYGEREVSVRTELDADSVMRTLKKTAATMDRKIDAFCEQSSLWQAESSGKSAASSDRPVPDAEDLSLYGDLLEALYSGNGDFALRQLRKVPGFLQRKGVETLDYSAETAELFDLMPTKKSSVTLRPALIAGEDLLLAGRAAEHIAS